MVVHQPALSVRLIHNNRKSARLFLIEKGTYLMNIYDYQFDAIANLVLEMSSTC
jgi:hypothetical protein